MNRFRDMAIQNYTRRLTAVILDFVQPEIAPFDPTTSKTLPWNQTRSGSDDPFRRYGHLKFSKMSASRYLGFDPTGSRSIHSIHHPRKPHPRIKHEVDRTSRSGDMAVRNFPRWQPAAILDLVQTKIAPFDPPTSKTLPENQTWSGSDEPLPRYGRSKFSKMRGRSVGRLVLNITLFSYTPLRYVRNVAREE